MTETRATANHQPKTSLSSKEPSPPLNNRPNRHFSKYQADDLNILTSYGDNIHNKQDQHTRIFFQNVKGLTHSTTSEDYEYYLHNLKTLQVDIAGLAETNSPWQLYHIRRDFLQQTKKHYQTSKTVFGSIDQQIDPVHSHDKFQAGEETLL